MISARVLNTKSSVLLYFSMMPLIASASIRAWAGSYTPHGRSQWASATAAGEMRSRSDRNRETVRIRKALFYSRGMKPNLLVGLTALTAIAVAQLRTLRLVVNRNSMLPGLFPGDRVLV